MRYKQGSKENLLTKIYHYSSQYINYKTGSITRIISGGIVFYINKKHGFLPSFEAFGKQFLYNLFIAGFNIKICEKLAKRFKSYAVSITTSTIIPTTQAFIITYGIHKLSGTPEAFDSSIWQVYANLPIFLGLGLYYRKRYIHLSDNSDLTY